MATIKMCTDILQSEVLAEFLPIESADMYYPNRTDVKYQCALPIEFKHRNPLLSQEIATWSLAALLGVIPNYKLSSEHNYHTCTAETSFGKETVAWFDNPVDACYEMILKLHELKML